LRTAQPTLVVTDQERLAPARQAAAEADARLRVAAIDDDLDTTPEADGTNGLTPVGPDDVFLINSTSGTTGLPKCVVHTQNRWHYFHQKAVANGELTSDDVFLSVLPMPFGFGIWTSHTTPIYLGATAIRIEKFDAGAACAAIAKHQATVLCCVSTQLAMILANEASRDYDLASLRVVFTGGEPLPYSQAARFEELTGATILQFYGSNETGMLSATTVADTLHRRLRTAGRIVPEMQVRLFDGDRDVTQSGRGQPACRGPALSLGYLGGTDHDKLFTKDGWMRMGDICELDADGYLTLTGRTSDFILRGGKNISAVQVEEAVATHPAVAVAAAVAMPDAIFGERVCVFVELKDTAALDLPNLVEHLLQQGVSKELLPERLEVLDELPRSSGGKIAKGQLRDRIRSTLEAK
jgi:acyl-CoA synthetase